MAIVKQSASVPSPVKKYLSFSGKTGNFSYWDKENKKEVEVTLPLKFVVLDELSTIVGWDDGSSSKIYSNEIHSTKKQQFVVRSKDGVKAEGFYNDIKGKLATIGAKYSKSVYVLIDGEICNINMKGAVLKAWIDKGDAGNTWSVSDTESRKKGSVSYKVPVFKKETDVAKDISKAEGLYTSILLPYLHKDIVSEILSEVEDDDFDNDMPF